MSGRVRAGLLVAAVVVLVGAFLLLRGGGGSETTDAASAPGPLLTGSSVVKLEVNKGDTVHFQIKAPRDLEVHIHGYNIMKDVKKGLVTPVSFKATIDGIFEIEFEDTSTQIASLRVNP